MVTVIIIAVAVCLGMIACVLFKPEVKIGKLHFAPYWVVALVGALLIIAVGGIKFRSLIERFTADTAVNPLKILGVFFGMTVLSIFLDEAGFFSYLASVALVKASKSQKKLFTVFYFTVAVLTVFTSNDIIILTFTPFIIYFCRSAGIDCRPYLVGEFAAANTFSLMLIIGNPTNIYLAAGMSFLRYLSVMALPALLTGIYCFVLIRVLFNKRLSMPMGEGGEIIPIKDKPLAFVALGLLAASTLMLAISGYIHLEMWYIAVGGAVLVFAFTCIYGCVKRDFSHVKNGLKRIPWQLAPFLLSMFTIVCALDEAGVCGAIGDFLTVGKLDIVTYLIASVLCANLLNNIAMSVLFGAVGGGEAALFATIIGSNLGALLTPVGALAGIMWTNMLKREKVDYSFGTFVKYGALLMTAMIPAGIGLYISLLI